MDRKLILLTAAWVLAAGFARAAEPELISVNQGAHHAFRGDSVRPSISDDGRIIAFESGARLTEDDRNKVKDVYVADRATKRLRRIVTRDERRKNGGPSVSGNGRFVVFHSYAYWTTKMKVPRISDLFVFDVESGKIETPLTAALGRTPDGESIFPVASVDAVQILFASNSSVLARGAKQVPTQIYVLDRNKNAVLLFSKNSDGAASNRICGSPRFSADGLKVAFLSGATNFDPRLDPASLSFHLYLVDQSTGTTTRIDVLEKGFDANEWMAGAFDMTADADVLVFEARRRIADDPVKALSSTDLFLYDRAVDTVTVLTAGELAGKSRNPSVSADGRYVAFIATDSGVMVHDRINGKWERIAGGKCDNPVMSKDGRVVAFEREDKVGKNIYTAENTLYEAVNAGH